MTVIDYVVEEVQRQGHGTDTLDGIERVGWMLDAWSYALENQDRKPRIEDLIIIGKKIERERNRGGIRKVGVRVGSQVCPPHKEVESLLFNLFARQDEMKPWDFYRGLLEVHPFCDGNGRSSKVIKAWLDQTLLRPEFPPADFWGRPIRNP